MSESDLKVVQENDNSEEEVIIKLKRWQIPRLLGAARLGIMAEDWCAALIQYSLSTFDTHSGRWILSVGHIIDQINEQTGITKEDVEYGFVDALNIISKWVGKKCIRFQKVCQEDEASYTREDLEKVENYSTARKKRYVNENKKGLHTNTK